LESTKQDGHEKERGSWHLATPFSIFFWKSRRPQEECLTNQQRTGEDTDRLERTWTELLETRLNSIVYLPTLTEFLEVCRILGKSPGFSFQHSNSMTSRRCAYKYLTYRARPSCDKSATALPPLITNVKRQRN